MVWPHSTLAQHPAHACWLSIESSKLQSQAVPVLDSLALTLNGAVAANCIPAATPLHFCYFGCMHHLVLPTLPLHNAVATASVRLQSIHADI